MWLIEAFVRNPVKVAVCVLLVSLFGAIALLRMPMQLTPEVQIPTISIETRWPGASPQEVEREIVQEQEEQLKGVEGVRKMTSTSGDSVATITLEFYVGSDMNEALVKVNSRLQQVPEYPEEADEPVISTSGGDAFIAWFIMRPRVPGREVVEKFQADNPDLAELLEPLRRAHNSGLRYQRLKMLLAERPELAERLKPVAPPDIDMTTLKRFAEDYVESAFERVPGVAQSNVVGGREDELRVVVDPQRLAARQLTINDVRNALRAQNADISGGDLWEGKRRYVVRTLGQFRSPEQVASAILARRDGRPVYVRDVAEVVEGFKKPDGMVRNFGADCIAINAQRETGANVLEVMAGLRETVDDLDRNLLEPRGLMLEQVYDETEYIYSSIGLVNSNIVLGGALTVIVLLMFLRSGRSTVVIALAIPTSIIGTFLILDLLGRSLNVISLAGLAFAVGMLVDNAIVVLENIYRHHQEGTNRWEASVYGAAEVWGAVVASTLTTLAVFLPVLFIEEEAGQLFRDIALAISAAVGLSLVVSITVIPTATAIILRRSRSEQNEAQGVHRRGRLATLALPLTAPLDLFGRGFVNGVVGLNHFLQRSIVLRLGVVAAFVTVSVFLSWLLMPPVEYLPEGNRNLVIGLLIPPAGYNLEKLTDLGEAVETKLQPLWDVDPDSAEAAELPFPPIKDYFYVVRNRQVFMGLKAHDALDARALIAPLQGHFNSVPGAFGLVFQSSLFGRGLEGGRSIDVEITGPELEELVVLGGQVMGQVGQVIPGAIAIPQPSLDLSSPELHIVPRWEQAADLGVTAADLGYAVDALVDGAKATDYYLGGDKIDLSIVGRETQTERTQDVQTLPISTPTGQVVPLAAVADVRISSGPEQINHRERQRAITIQVTPPPHVPLEQAMQLIDQQIVAPLVESGGLGLNQIRLAGTADKLTEAWNALRWNLVLALIITYLLMAALFESWLYPLVIILTVPLGAVGGFLGLAALNLFVLQPLDVLTMLGFVILIGTVVNNPILIVHQSLNHMRLDGMTPGDAIAESVRTRIRPIFMTTLTTTLGLLPLVLIPGAGSELYRGLGSVLLGGLLVSTLFTLVLVPSLFSLVMEARQGMLNWLGWSGEDDDDAHAQPNLPPRADHENGDGAAERPGATPGPVHAH